MLVDRAKSMISSDIQIFPHIYMGAFFIQETIGFIEINKIEVAILSFEIFRRNIAMQEATGVDAFDISKHLGVNSHSLIEVKKIEELIKGLINILNNEIVHIFYHTMIEISRHIFNFIL